VRRRSSAGAGAQVRGAEGRAAKEERGPAGGGPSEANATQPARGAHKPAPTVRKRRGAAHAQRAGGAGRGGALTRGVHLVHHLVAHPPQLGLVVGQLPLRRARVELRHLRLQRPRGAHPGGHALGGALQQRRRRQPHVLRLHLLQQLREAQGDRIPAVRRLQLLVAQRHGGVHGAGDDVVLGSGLLGGQRDGRAQQADGVQRGGGAHEGAAGAVGGAAAVGGYLVAAARLGAALGHGQRRQRAAKRLGGATQRGAVPVRRAAARQPLLQTCAQGSKSRGTPEQGARRRRALQGATPLATREPGEHPGRGGAQAERGVVCSAAPWGPEWVAHGPPGAPRAAR
jgi:hypothetical protein